MLLGKSFKPSDVLDILRRRWWLLVLPPLVTFFIALVYASKLSNVYQSDMLIAVVPQRVPDEYVRTTVTLKTEEQIDAITVQVTSRTSLEQLIHEFELYPNARAHLPMEDVVVMMRGAIEVELERQRRGPRGLEPPHAFHVRFTYTDPRIAALVTQRLGSLFVDQNALARVNLGDATNQFLEGQLADARARLVAQERRLESFRERFGNSLPTQMQSNMQAIQATQMQIQAQVDAIARDRDRKLMLERLYREASNEPAVTRAAPQAQATGATVDAGGTAQQQLAAAKSALARLELRLKPEHPDVVRTKKLIADLEPKAAAEAGSGTTTAVGAVSPEESARRERLRQMAAEIESLDRQMAFKEKDEARLRVLVAEYQRRIEAVPGLEAEYASLTRDYDTLQERYKDLLRKSEASKVALDLERRQIGEQFRVLDSARVPVHPTSPMRLQINAIGLAIGLVLGLGLVAFLELRDNSFRTEADVLEVLSLPVVALVPHVSTARERSQETRRRWMLAAAGLALASGAGYVVWSMRLWNHLA